MRSPTREPDQTLDDPLQTAGGQNLGVVRLEPASVGGDPADGIAERRLVLGSPREPLNFRRPGSGKSHALAALSHQLILKGRSLIFTTCSLLVQQLLIAKRDLRLEKVIKQFGHFEGLIIDDLGYVQQSREEMEVLFTLLAEGYERGSVLLTSNLAFSKWDQIFKDAMTTAAAIDRLVHHSVILELNVPSYRVETAKQTKSRGRTTTNADAPPAS